MGVVKGFQQKQGLDYFETFAAVAKPASYKIQVLLALPAHYFYSMVFWLTKWMLSASQWNTPGMDIYMRLPKGVQCSEREQNRGTRHAICKLI